MVGSQPLEHVIDGVETLLPQLLVPADPCVDLAEWSAVDSVEALPALVPDLHQTHLPEDPQVLGHLRLGLPEPIDQLTHGTLALREEFQDPTAARFGHRIERVGSRRCSGHGANIYSYGNVSRMGSQSGTGTPARSDESCSPDPSDRV